jgi:hypothetical protein
VKQDCYNNTYHTTPMWQVMGWTKARSYGRIVAPRNWQRLGESNRTWYSARSADWERLSALNGRDPPSSPLCLHLIRLAAPASFPSKSASQCASKSP